MNVGSFLPIQVCGENSHRHAGSTAAHADDVPTLLGKSPAGRGLPLEPVAVDRR